MYFQVCFKGYYLTLSIITANKTFGKETTFLLQTTIPETWFDQLEPMKAIDMPAYEIWNPRMSQSI